MFAHGDFLKLLLASTEERKQIFRKIFHSDVYLEVQNRIKQDYLMQQSDVRRIRNAIVQDMQAIEADETILEEWSRQAQEGIGMETALAYLEEQIGQDQHALQIQKKQREDHRHRLCRHRQGRKPGFLRKAAAGAEYPSAPGQGRDQD